MQILKRITKSIKPVRRDGTESVMYKAGYALGLRAGIKARAAAHAKIPGKPHRDLT